MSELATVELPPRDDEDATARVQLTRHFWLHEFSVSAGHPHLATGVPEAVVPAVRRLAEGVLQPWRNVIGAIRLTSGFRSAALNRAVRGSETSQHRRGEAADCRPLDVALAEAWAALWALGRAGQLDAGQVIYYPADGFIHVATPSPRYGAFTPCVRWPASFTGYPVCETWAEFQRLSHVRLAEPVLITATDPASDPGEAAAALSDVGTSAGVPTSDTA